MFAKLLSILSVRYVMTPDRHYILYDEEPRANLDWQCACLLATCVPVTLRSEIFGHTLDAAVDEKDRYASDKRNRCANSQLDLLRLETLMNDAGGFFLDLDVYVLKSLDEWRTRCGGHEAVFCAMLRRESGRRLNCAGRAAAAQSGRAPRAAQIAIPFEVVERIGDTIRRGSISTDSAM